MKSSKSKAYRLAIRGILIAIIIIQTIVPFLGLIPLFGIVSLTIIHITVIVAAVTLGTVDGMIIGLTWGLTTLLRAFTAPTSVIDTLVFTNPIVSVLPRVLVGLVAGVTFTFVYNKTKNISLSAIFSAALGTLTNTVLVLGLMGILYTGPVAEAYGTTSSGLFAVLLGVVGANGIPEVLAACFIVPIIARVLFHATKLSPENRG